MEGRLSDIPYLTSPPLLFTFQQTAAVAAGTYTFAGDKAAFTPSRPIQPNILYMFETLDFSMDIAPADYFSAISTQPQFSMYLQSDASSPSLREPLILAKYFDTVPYRLAVMGSELLGVSNRPTLQGFQSNRLLGNVSGVMNQTSSLLGKMSLTAILVFSVQEVGDHDFIADFKQRAGSTKRGRGF